MLDMDFLYIRARAAGFTAAAPLDAGTLSPNVEVRAMCQNNVCGQYGQRWSCPPGCGTLEECAARLQTYRGGILVQTIGILEDEFDGEGMIKTEARHKVQFQVLWEDLRTDYPQLLALSSGCCTRCKICTYPISPCRTPNAVFSSMEAYGLLVLDVCRRNHLPYYYGKAQIAYTSCFLLE